MSGPVYAFDVLPIHPPPEPLESFTGYLMRLAESNGITRYSDLAYRLFPGRTSVQVRAITDHVPVTFGSLAREAACTDAELLETTFYPLGRKFGRCVRARPMGFFLSGALAPHLRYCPRCLDRQPYHRLPWRFLALVGCHEHGVRLLDRCGACHQAIPLFANSLKVGVCPHCGTLLSTSIAEPLSPQEGQEARETQRDLAFLLSSQPWETEDLATAIAAGREFERLRWKKGLSPRAVSRQTGLTSAGIRSIERGRVGLPGATFVRYVQYASYLGVSLRRVFLDGLDNNEPAPDDASMTHEMRLAVRLQRGIDRIQTSGQFVTSTTVREATGVTWHTFRRYPATRAILNQAQDEQYQQCEQELLAQVKEAARQLQTQGKLLYRLDIYKRVGVSARVLRSYPRIRDYLKQLDIPSAPGQRVPLRPRQCEQTLLGRVEQAVQHLLDTGQIATQEAVAKQVGMCLAQLLRYPQVKLALHQVPAIRFEQRQTQVLEQVYEATAHLEALGQSVTRKAVMELTGLGYGTLARFPRVNAIFTRYQAEQSREQQEDRVNRVLQAIAYLKEYGLPVTQTTICEAAGLCESTPRHHADLREIIQPVLDEEEQRHIQHIIEQTRKAVERLRSLNRPVCMPAVCELVGMSQAGLREYPQVVILVREARAAARQEYEDDLIQRIHQAIQHLRSESLSLTQQNICGVIGMSPNTLRYYRQAKGLVDHVAKQPHQR